MAARESNASAASRCSVDSQHVASVGDADMNRDTDTAMHAWLHGTERGGRTRTVDTRETTGGPHLSLRSQPHRRGTAPSRQGDTEPAHPNHTHRPLTHTRTHTHRTRHMTSALEHERLTHGGSISKSFRTAAAHAVGSCRAVGEMFIALRMSAGFCCGGRGIVSHGAGRSTSSSPSAPRSA